MDGDTETQRTEQYGQNDEMQAINEQLVIAAVRQQELAEAALESASSALKSGALYRLLAANFPGGMVLLFDHDLRHVLADGQELAALGLSKQAMEGRTVWETFAPQTCGQIETAYRAALAGVSTVLEVRFPAETYLRENKEHLYRVHTLPARDERDGILIGMAVVHDITEQRRAEEAIRWQAHHDALTGLPNRALLYDRLNQVLAMSQRSGESAALLFLDLDDFKHVNDTLGHDAGDRLLQIVAARLTGCLRVEDTVARLGGDEFVVLLPSLHAAGDAAQIAQKILAEIAKPFVIDHHEMEVTASVGIGIFPFDARDAALLMKAADDAMYRFKKEHGAGPAPMNTVDLQRKSA